jgi:hypothetical protein
MQQRQADGEAKMSELTGLCLRALRICALACLPLLGACAGQFAGSTHSPPRVDVPEPGNGRTAPVTRAPATAQPQPKPSVAKVYPATPASTAARAPAYPAAQPPQGGPALPSAYPGAPAPASTMPLPGADSPASEDSFTIEAPATAGPAGSAGGAGQIDLQAPPPSARCVAGCAARHCPAGHARVRPCSSAPRPAAQGPASQQRAAQPLG